MSEIKKHIPQGWCVKSIGKIGFIYNGLTGKTKEDFGIGMANYITFLNVLCNPIIKEDLFEKVNVGYSEKQNKAKIGDLFFNTSSETPEEVGLCACLNKAYDNLYLNSFCFGFRIKDSEIFHLYIPYFFRGHEGRHIMTLLAQGSTRYNLPKSEFKKAEILLPPLNEQQRIVRLLTCLDEAIEKTETLIEKYRRIKQGMMHDLLTYGIDKEGSIRSPKTHRFKPSPLGMIPEEWECVELGSLYNLRSGTTPNRSVSKYFNPEGMLWVKTLDLNETHISDTEEKISDFALKMTSLSIQPSGSVLVAMYGGWQQIGRTGILDQPATTNQAIVSLTPKQGINLLSEYTQYFLQTYRRYWKRYAVSTRKDPNISKGDVIEFKITYPLDGEEQSIICKRINECESYINDQVATARKLKELRKGLLHDLLTGKVRIPETVNI